MVTVQTLDTSVSGVCFEPPQVTFDCSQLGFFGHGVVHMAWIGRYLFIFGQSVLQIAQLSFL